MSSLVNVILWAFSNDRIPVQFNTDVNHSSVHHTWWILEGSNGATISNHIGLRDQDNEALSGSSPSGCATLKEAGGKGLGLEVEVFS